LVPPTIEKITFDDLEKIILNDYRVNKRKSIDRLKGSLNNLKVFFGGVKAIHITTDRILEYVNARQEAKAANATINRELAALKRMFRLGLALDKVLKVPALSLLQEDNIRQGFFEKDELDLVLPHLPAPFRPIIETAYITGWRIDSEILTRQWRHVNLNDGWLRLEPGETKNKKGRMFPFTPELREVILSQRQLTDEVEKATGKIIPWVFHHRNGKRIVNFYRSWRSACKKAGLPGRQRHDFRRTAVRNLERAGVPRSTAMKMVGHQTESIYRRYAIVDEAMLKEGAEKLSAFHKGESSSGRRVVPFKMSQRRVKDRRSGSS
jgi:integrase